MPPSLPSSRTAWCGGFLALAALVLLFWSGRLPVEVGLTAWITWGALAVVLLRHWWTWLFGPVFFWDLVRTSRQSRNTVFRCLYALGLLVVLYFVYERWFGNYLGNLEDLFRPAALPRDAVPQFAGSFFSAFLIVQLLTVALVTPACVAGAITEERERGTLEFICTTDLTPREIVLGKFLSRLAILILLVLAGLPVLSLTVFLGGIDPVRLLMGFVMTLLVIFSIGGVAMLVSVNSRRTLNAVIGTYIIVVLFVTCCPFLGPLVCVNPLFLLWDSPLSQAGLVGGQPDQVMMLMIFGAAHIAAGIFCLILAIDGLTWRPYPVDQGVLARALPVMPAQDAGSPSELKPVEPVVPPAPMLVPQPVDYRPPRPPVGGHALIWKELHAEPPFHMTDFGPLITVLGVMLLAILTIILLVAGLAYSEVYPLHPTGLGRYLSPIIRLLAAGIGTCSCLGVGIVSSMAVSREKERRTLDGLLTLPVESDEILFAKLLGAGYAMRASAWNLGLIWLVGLLTGGFHIVGLCLLVLATILHAAFVATLGLWLSTICRSSTQALLLTLLLILLLLSAPWLLAGQFDRLFASLGLNSATIRFINEVQEYLTPTLAEYWLGFPLGDQESWSELPAILTSLLIYGLVGWGLWIATRRRLADNRVGADAQ